MLTEALLSAVAEAVFGHLLQEANLADRVRAVLGVGPSGEICKIYDSFNGRCDRYPLCMPPCW